MKNYRALVYQESWVTLADIRPYTFTTLRAVMQIRTMKLRTVLPSPSAITVTDSSYTLAIVVTCVWAVNDWKKVQ